MNVKNVERENGTAKVTVEIAKDEFQTALDKAYAKVRKDIMIPGFRKGKAPRKFVERMYGSQVFYEDAVNEIFPEIYEAAIVKQELKAVGQPSVTDMQTPEDGSVVLTVSTELYPEVTLGEYKGIEVAKKAVSVGKADVDAELNRMAERNSRIETVEREAKNGDTVVIDFEGFVDGKAFEGGKAEKYNLHLGTGAFIPGFEDQLVGTKAGDEKAVEVTFPEDYNSKELAGKAATFQCKVHEVKETIKPELDDEFAKDVSEFDTLADLKKDIKARLTKTRQEESDRAFEDAAVDAAAKNMTVEIPACMIDEQVDRQMEQFGYQLQMQGMKMEDYAKMMGGNVDGLRQSLRPMAEQTVRTSLLLEAVAEAEKIEVLDEEVEEELKKMADQYQMELEKVKAAVSADSVREELKTRKAAKFIAENAKAVEEKPAKKTTKKKAAEAPDEEAPAAEAEAEKE